MEQPLYGALDGTLDALDEWLDGALYIALGGELMHMTMDLMVD